MPAGSWARDHVVAIQADVRALVGHELPAVHGHPQDPLTELIQKLPEALCEAGHDYARD